MKPPTRAQNQAAAKQVTPEAIDGNTGRQGVFVVGDPVGDTQAGARQCLGCRVESPGKIG